jgi:tRNA (guanine9-N1)-methyltransferase
LCIIVSIIMQVLTVNQVFEIMLKFVETRDWKTAFFHVIPQRKRGEAETGDDGDKGSLDDNDAAQEGAADGDHSEEDLNKGFDEEEVDDDGDEELEEEETDVSNKRQCVRLENGEAGDHYSGAVAEATDGDEATLQAEQAKESNNVGGD